ncbi:MAG: hypothetical protein K9N09_04820 [Candidatus Cloacimonetes bacterium]|nr:hypothetical protein [Candidatus Cloacimonadota bacterium]MCF7814737.1 hypothetical protein [Candidatus Cloacimonadota bacterium]MCF7868005.1 hypothetical protein [Candidatus Cloacimonadota bacterium]MCF7883463.1 hypothetical protein [Candidatus Cloacimonadota bacterium]
MKIKSLLFFALLFSALFAQQNSLEDLLNSLLEKHPDYQQTISRYEQEKSLFKIDKSLNWFDVNFIYQQWDNEFVRDETETTLEHSEVDEKDKRWRIELEKQFFPKDFDNAADAIGSRLDMLRYEQDKILSYYTCSSDIFDDMISWYEAAGMIDLLQKRLEILYQQNELLEEMEAQNLIDPEILIDNLEEIDDKEDDMFDFVEILEEFEREYGEILEDFVTSFDGFVSAHSQPDTLLFIQKIDKEISHLNKEISKIANKIKFNYYYFYMPEINLTLSYNWRETRQDWIIEKNNILKNRKRDQDEEFPEAEIELSLPFNIFSNTSGKLALLKAYERELHYRSTEMIFDWKSFKVERLNSLQEASLELKRKTRLKELYNKNLALQNEKYKEEPSLLGGNPEFNLEIEKLKTKKAEIRMKMAEMKLYKEIFLINSLGEETK